MFAIASNIRNKYSHLIGDLWNGRASIRQYKKLREYVTDKESRAIIDDFFGYSKKQMILLISGITLLLLIGFLNSYLNS